MGRLTAPVEGSPDKGNKMEKRMRFTSCMKMFIGLGAAVAIAVTVPTAANAAPMSATARAAAVPHRAAWSVSSSSSPAFRLPACPNSTFCAFQNANFGGTRFNFAFARRPHNRWFFVGAAANDKISSFFNHRAFQADVAKNCPVNVDWEEIPRGGAIPNLTTKRWPDGSSGNDSISALALDTTNGNFFPGHSNCR